MHETALMRDLVQKISEIAGREGGGRVVRIKVRLGALSHLTPVHFMEHFHEDAAGSPAAGAEVDFVMCDDIHDPLARDVILESVELADA